MKKILLFLITAVLLSILTNNSASACGKDESAALIYKITKVQNGQYWGVGVYDNSQVYFTKDYIKSGTVDVQDVVVAYFDPNNLEDGLIEVEKAVPVGFDE